MNKLSAKVLGTKSVESNTPMTPKSTRKRNAPRDFEDYSGDAEGESATKKPRKKKGEEPEEKRLKRFRAKPPVSYLDRLERAKGQRMFMIDRDRTLSEDGAHEEEVFSMAGTTGNIYQVTISKVPSCTCPDAKKGNQCKHIVYVGTTITAMACLDG